KLDISTSGLAMFFQERSRLLRRAAGSLRISIEQRGIVNEERVRILLLEVLQYFQNTGGILLALVIAGPQVVEIIAQHGLQRIGFLKVGETLSVILVEVVRVT